MQPEMGQQQSNDHYEANTCGNLLKENQGMSA